MMTRLRYAALIGALATVTAAAQDVRLTMLPEALREHGRSILAEPDEAKRADLAETLAERDVLAALDFLLALLQSDPSPVVRAEIVDELESVTDPRIDGALTRRVAEDPDVDVAMSSLELLRARSAAPLRRLLEQRLEAERRSGPSPGVDRLMAEQERWTSIVRGTLLPTFLQAPPPVFAVTAARRPIRVLAFGDFGDGSEAQRTVAAAMRTYHRRRPFDFGVTLGDNFYPSGMSSPADTRWRTEWSMLYDPLKIPFYATLGNHDYNQPNSPAAEILFARLSPTWRMPATYYTFTAGAVQFFALDTDII